MKKAKSVIIIVLAVLIMLAGLFLGLAGVGAGWFFAVLGVALIVWQNLLDKKAKKEAAADAERKAYEAKKKSVEIMLPVVGEKYDNDDGSSRQKILKSFCDEAGTGVAYVSLEQYEHEGAPAIHVVTEEGCVGNIRANDVEKVLPLLGGKWMASPQIYITSEEDDDENVIYQADIFLYPSNE